MTKNNNYAKMFSPTSIESIFNAIIKVLFSVMNLIVMIILSPIILTIISIKAIIIYKNNMKIIQVHREFIRLTNIYKGSKLVFKDFLYYPIAYIKFMYYSLFNK